MYQNKLCENDSLKKEIDTIRPLSETALKQIKNYFKIGFTYSSNALEGNTLSLSETKIIIEDGITIGGKPVREHLEAIGCANAYDYLFECTAKTQMSEMDILNLHKILYQGINFEKAGVYRDCNVLITGSEYKFPKYQDVPDLMKEFVDLIYDKQTSLHPVEFASWLHERLVSIHPFVDGNGRCARLLMNLALLKSGYNIVIIPPIVRNDYICTLQEAQLNSNPIPFTNFISEMVLESQKEYLRILKQLSD